MIRKYFPISLFLLLPFTSLSLGNSPQLRGREKKRFCQASIEWIKHKEFHRLAFSSEEEGSRCLKQIFIPPYLDRKKMVLKKGGKGIFFDFPVRRNLPPPPNADFLKKSPKE